MLKKYLFLLNFILLSSINFAQVGIGTSNPNASAVLDINSNNKGVLIPKLSSSERTNIINPANGLLIYNTTCNCLEYNQGSPTVPNWISLDKSWSLSGNSNSNPTVDFIGTLDAKDFVIKTNNTEALRVDTTGNMGIGTILPKAKLDVNGTIKIGSTSATLPEAGMMRFNTTSNKFEGYDGTSWKELN